MPGAPYEHMIPGFGPASIQEARMNPQTSAQGQATHTGFIIWLAIIGVVLPVLILGGLKVGGFSFVYKSR